MLQALVGVCNGRTHRWPNGAAATTQRLPLLCRAAEALQANNQQRLDAIENLAREQCDAVGEADLRRLKRQFSSLKNTFLHYEVKQTFIAGAPQGG